MTAVNRFLVIHLGAGTCLYDHIWDVEKTKWHKEDDFHEDEDFEEIQPSAGTIKEQDQREDTVKLLQAMYKFSVDHDLGILSKCCFHTPSQTRATSFAPTYKPLFGTLPRPKQLVAQSLQSLVFNQNEQELVTARHKRLNLLAACFYGSKTNESEAREFCQESLREFAHQFRETLKDGDTADLLKKYEESDADDEINQELVMKAFVEFDDFIVHYYDHQFKSLQDVPTYNGYFSSETRGLSDDTPLTKYDDVHHHVSFEISTEH